MSAAPQRGRRRADPVRRPSLFGPSSAHSGTRKAARTAGHAAAAPASPATTAVSATAKCMAAVAVVGALVAAGAIAQQIGAPSGPDSLASIVSAAEAPAATSEAAVSAPIDAAITFPGVKVSSSAPATAAPVKVESSSVKPVDDPAAAQAYASGQLGSFGWGADQMSCLTQLWQRESEWLTSAENVSSGAYGIAQSLPASKMESTGSDWSTNYETQIRWGMGYIHGRYGSPCAAWGHSNAVGWY